MILARDTGDLMIEIVVLGQHHPLECDPEDRSGDVPHCHVDIDIGPQGAVGDTCLQARLDLDCGPGQLCADAVAQRRRGLRRPRTPTRTSPCVTEASSAWISRTRSKCANTCCSPVAPGWGSGLRRATYTFWKASRIASLLP